MESTFTAENFRDILNRLLEESGFTKSELAKKMGIDRKSIGNWTRKDNPIPPNIENLWRLSDVFGVSIDFLVGKIPYESIGHDKIEKRKKCALRLENLIEEKFKTDKAFRDACAKVSHRKGNEDGIEYISKYMLSQIKCGLAPLTVDKAEVFAEVLDVEVGYLLGYTDYPTQEQERKAIIREELRKQLDSANVQAEQAQKFLDFMLAVLIKEDTKRY